MWKKPIQSAMIVALAGTIGTWPISVQAGSDQQKPILLKKSDGQQLSLPQTGPFANQDATETALKIQSFDEQEKKWERTQKKDKSLDPEVLAEMRTIAVEARDDSIDHIDLAYRIAKRTSGPLDGGIIKQAEKEIEYATKIFSTAPPASVFVHTEITIASGASALHYCLKAEYQGQATSWHSYNFGQKLHIGRYIFHGIAAKQGQLSPYEEEVLVLADPTILRLTQLE